MMTVYGGTADWFVTHGPVMFMACKSLPPVSHDNTISPGLPPEGGVTPLIVMGGGDIGGGTAK